MVRLTEKGWGVAGRMGLLGRIAAGRGLEAVATDEAYSLAAELLASRSGRRRYLLRVVGRSMVGARIEDGDLLVVEEDESPPDGSIVVILLREGEEVTVKRFYREGEMLRLKPEAPQGGYEEMVVPAEEARVQGRVVYVLHPPGRKSRGGGRA
jgi:repressor LexA